MAWSLAFHITTLHTWPLLCWQTFSDYILDDLGDILGYLIMHSVTSLIVIQITISEYLNIILNILMVLVFKVGVPNAFLKLRYVFAFINLRKNNANEDEICIQVF